MSEPLDPQLIAFGQSLAGLAPAPLAIDRDRILYEAGRTAARPRPWGWVAAALVAGFAMAMSQWPDEQRVGETRVVTRPMPVMSPTEERPSSAVATLPIHGPSAGYLKLRNEVVAWGTDMLPTVRSTTVLVQPVDIRWKPTKLRGEL